MFSISLYSGMLYSEIGIKRLNTFVIGLGQVSDGHGRALLSSGREEKSKFPFLSRVCVCVCVARVCIATAQTLS